MSKKRYIDTKFWSDAWVVDDLNPLDRYLFLYLLTNEKTNIAGVYEMSLRTMAYETGIDKEELGRMLAKLESRVVYSDSWVVLRNTIRHQNYTNSKVRAGIIDALDKCPSDLLHYVNTPDDFDIRGVGLPVPEKGYRVTASQRFKVLRRDDYTCQYCGARAPEAILHVDHKIPITKGGTNTLDNLVTACADCNVGKGDSMENDETSRDMKTHEDPSHSDYDSDLDSDSDLTTNVGDSAEKPKKKSTSTVADARKVIDFYNQVFGTDLRHLEGRVKKVQVRLKTYSGRDICVAIRNAKLDPFYNGDNDRHWNGSLDYLVRSDENIEKYLNFKPPQTKKKLYV